MAVAMTWQAERRGAWEVPAGSPEEDVGPPARFRTLSSTRSMTSDPRATPSLLLTAAPGGRVSGLARSIPPADRKAGRLVGHAAPRLLGPARSHAALARARLFPHREGAAGLTCWPGLPGSRRGITTHTNRNSSNLSGSKQERFIPPQLPRPAVQTQGARRAGASRSPERERGPRLPPNGRQLTAPGAPWPAAASPSPPPPRSPLPLPRPECPKCTLPEEWRGTAGEGLCAESGSCVRSRPPHFATEHVRGSLSRSYFSSQARMATGPALLSR